MTFVPDTKASVRLYQRHQHYARPARLRYSAQKFAFIAAEETALTQTFTQIFNFLYANSAYKISQVGVAGNSITTAAGLTADPYPAASA